MEHDTEGDTVLARTDGRVVEIPIPLAWHGWNPVDELVLSFVDVVFLADFGCFKAGEMLPFVNVDYSKGTVTEYAEDGSVVREQLWRAVPLPPSDSLREADIREIERRDRKDIEGFRK